MIGWGIFGLGGGDIYWGVWCVLMVGWGWCWFFGFNMWVGGCCLGGGGRFCDMVRGVLG